MKKDIEYENYHDKELDLYDLWLTLKKRWVMILIITVVSTGLALTYTFLQSKVYTVHNILIFNQMQEWGFVNQGEIAAAVTVLDKINKQKDFEKDNVLALLGMNTEDLEGIKNISATEIKGSATLWVDIDTCDRRKGVALMEALPDYIVSTPNIANKLKTSIAIMTKNRAALKSILDDPTRNLKLTRDAVVYLPSIDLYALQDKYHLIDAMIEKMERGNLLSLAWKTKQPTKHSRPKKVKNILIGMIVGCFLGVLTAFTLEWSENARRTHSKGLK